MAMMNSSSRLFARRGNPWLTRREQIETFNRNPEIENAEYDFDRISRARQAAHGATGQKTVFTLFDKHFKQAGTVDTQVSKRVEGSPQERVVNIIRSHRMQETKPVKCTDNRGTRVHAGHEWHTMRARRAAIANAAYLFVKYSDGTEEEPEFSKLSTAVKAFDFKRRHATRKGVVEIELWGPDDLIKRWTACPKGRKS